MNRFFRLPFVYNEAESDRDTEICLSQEWSKHFNTKDYDGEWTVLSLRSCSGSILDISSHPGVPFRDTPLMGSCSYFRRITESFLCEKEAVRILKLAPGSKILTHRDRGAGYAHGFFRLHIPLRSAPGVSFVIGGDEVPMKKGECWYADFDLPHSVENNSNTDRIHLVIDGVRNDWTDHLFAEAGYDFSVEKKGPDQETVMRMIAELERMNTETSKSMIADLKSKLHA